LILNVARTIDTPNNFGDFAAFVLCDCNVPEAAEKVVIGRATPSNVKVKVQRVFRVTLSDSDIFEI
jgi:hypothetical protein